MVRLLCLVAVWACCAFAATAVEALTLYEIDFDNDPVGVPRLGTGPFPRDAISEVRFGSPRILARAGDLSQLLAFDGIGRTGQLEQVALDIPGSPTPLRRFRLELDLFVGSLGGNDIAPSRFAILIDSPSSTSVLFDGNGDVFLVQGLTYTPIATFSIGRGIHVSMGLDLVAQRWAIDLGADGPPIGAPYTGAEPQRVRFSLQNLAGTSTNLVAVDNIRVVTVPEPSPAVLAISIWGILSLASGHRRA